MNAVRWLLRGSVYLLVALIPLIWLVAQGTREVGINLEDYRPVYYDELIYWHQAGTFLQYGWQGGYYTFEEEAAPLTLTRFDLHGPLYPMFYALFGAASGRWNYDSVLWANAFYCGLLIGVTLFAARPRMSHALLFGGILLTFHPFQIYLFTSMTELLHYGFAFLLAPLFARLLLKPDAVRPRDVVFIAGLLVFLSLFRLFWVFLALPLFLLAVRRSSILHIGRAFVFTALTAVIALVPYWLLNARYPYYHFQTMISLFREQPTLDNAVRLVTDRIAYNLERAAQSDLYERILRLQGVLLLIAVPVMGVAGRWRISLHPLIGWVGRGLVLPWREVLFHLCNLGIIMAVQLVLYDMYAERDYRMIAPHLLLSLLILVLCHRQLGVIIAGVGIILGFSLYTQGYGSAVSVKFVQNDIPVEAFRDDLADTVVFQPSANGWCNTLTIIGWDPELIAVPFGIGINSHLAPGYIRRIPNARYALLTPEEYVNITSRLPGATYTLLAETHIGNLYRNEWAWC